MEELFFIDDATYSFVRLGSSGPFYITLTLSDSSSLSFIMPAHISDPNYGHITTSIISSYTYNDVTYYSSPLVSDGVPLRNNLLDYSTAPGSSDYFAFFTLNGHTVALKGDYRLTPVTSLSGVFKAYYSSISSFTPVLSSSDDLFQDALTNIGSVTSAIVEVVPDVAGAIVDSPLLSFSIGFLFFGVVVAMIGRLLSRS